ncbi:ATP-binding protein [Eggerthella sp.]|uniref:ATP-binding protein n=1 Tax=Eggerthellaceae TaxID=1643826 RepID=UPI0028463F73|nr:ATP-binding protein [Eggerthella sp.]MDR3848477.1 ATP-binding protein [Eggerthella sp.]
MRADEIVRMLGSSGRKPEEGDYVGADGLLVCGKCGTPKECLVSWQGSVAKLGCACACEREEAELYDARASRAAKMRAILSSPSQRLCCKAEPGCDFETADDSRRGFRVVRAFADRWERMAPSGYGMTLIGPSGTGKTFAANCLANRLRSRGLAVMVTNVALAESVLWDAKGVERTRVLEGLSAYDLLVIDDLGAERETPYMDSRAFDLVDACYRSGRPLVVTTNIPLAQLKDPKGLSRTRIYDRVLERCQPVIFDGPSFRAEKAARNREAMRAILAEGDGPGQAATEGGSDG